MAELIAQGSTFENRWRRRLSAGAEVCLGRSCHGFSVDWDTRISRQHATLILRDQVLEVVKIPAAGNPIFFDGQESTSFTMTDGQHFVIGETTFNFSVNQALATVDVPNPIEQKTFSHQFLKQVRYRDADRRISVLNRLPDVIASAGNEEDLLTKMVNTLLAGISSASAIGIVQYRRRDDQAEVIHWDRRSLHGGDFEASQRLIRQSVDGGETVLYFWNKSAVDQGVGKTSPYTFNMGNDWAFACPMDDQSASDDSWVVYVTGRNEFRRGDFSAVKPNPIHVHPMDSNPINARRHPVSPSSESDLEGDIKFCELIASTLCNLLQLRKLERRQSSLRRFFSPAVLRAFANDDPDRVLQPRQCRVSVLFCDLRGFSKTSEAMADDLLKLLSVVSQSLGVMTRVILQQGGVIGDFHGDAAMGFWGWPIDQPDAATQAVTAAIEIQNQITRMAADDDADVFRMGIGIGTGQAVAGRIGTDDQVKVTAFGPVVNIASRLEGMTKQLGSSILIDQSTASELEALAADRDSAPSCGGLTPVPMGSIVPFAMDRPVNVFRINTSTPSRRKLTIDEVQKIRSAVDHFTGGRWELALESLASIPEDDPTKTLLIKTIDGRVRPPESFDGWIVMNQK